MILHSKTAQKKYTVSMRIINNKVSQYVYYEKTHRIKSVCTETF